MLYALSAIGFGIAWGLLFYFVKRSLRREMIEALKLQESVYKHELEAMQTILEGQQGFLGEQLERHAHEKIKLNNMLSGQRKTCRLVAEQIVEAVQANDTAKLLTTVETLQDLGDA